MFTTTRTYKDYNGNERTEDFRFALNEAEVMEMELGMEGGMGDYLKKIVNAKDTPSIMKIFKELLLKSYGEKSPDGRQFVKSEELSKAFSETPVYSELFVELATDDKKAAEFINNIMPKSLAEQADPNAKNPGTVTALPSASN